MRQQIQQRGEDEMTDAEQRGQATKAVAGAGVAGGQLRQAVGAESPTSSEMAEQLREFNCRSKHQRWSGCIRRYTS